MRRSWTRRQQAATSLVEQQTADANSNRAGAALLFGICGAMKRAKSACALRRSSHPLARPGLLAGRRSWPPVVRLQESVGLVARRSTAAFQALAQGVHQVDHLVLFLGLVALYYLLA